MKYNLGGNLKMEQVMVCLKSNDIIKIDVLDSRRKELVALGKALLSGNKNSIKEHARAALDLGATHEEIMKVVAFIMSDARLLKSILQLMKILSYEESQRTEPISIIDDVRE